MKVKSECEDAQSYPTLSNPVDYSLPGSSIRGILQARVLEWGGGILLGHKNKILPFAAATRMDLEGIIVSKSDRERQMLYHLFVESKTYNKLVNITAKKETDSQIQRTT